MEQLQLKITLEKPTPGVDFGLQKGKGNQYETVQRQRSAGEDLLFECLVTVKGGADGQPVLLGPFVQGPPGGRFIYIDIGKAAGQPGAPWSRRLKIPLYTISPEMLAPAFAGEQVYLQTVVPGTGKDGGPNCATVKPFEGWKLV